MDDKEVRLTRVFTLSRVVWVVIAIQFLLFQIIRYMCS